MDEQDGITIRGSPELANLSIHEKENLYRTKDIYATAFLLSRGFHWYGLEEREITQFVKNKFQKNSVKKKRLIFFYFKERENARNLSLNYYNGTSANLNVNASIFVQNILTVRSIITDPPF